MDINTCGKVIRFDYFYNVTRPPSLADQFGARGAGESGVLAVEWRTRLARTIDCHPIEDTARLPLLIANPEILVRLGRREHAFQFRARFQCIDCAGYPGG